MDVDMATNNNDKLDNDKLDNDKLDNDNEFELEKRARGGRIEYRVRPAIPSAPASTGAGVGGQGLEVQVEDEDEDEYELEVELQVERESELEVEGGDQVEEGQVAGGQVERGHHRLHTITTVTGWTTGNQSGSGLQEHQHEDEDEEDMQEEVEVNLGKGVIETAEVEVRPFSDVVARDERAEDQMALDMNMNMDVDAGASQQQQDDTNEAAVDNVEADANIAVIGTTPSETTDQPAGPEGHLRPPPLHPNLLTPRVSTPRPLVDSIRSLGLVHTASARQKFPWQRMEGMRYPLLPMQVSTGTIGVDSRVNNYLPAAG